MPERGAQRSAVLLRGASPAERIDRQQHVANLRDLRQQLVRDEPGIAAIALQLRDQKQSFESAVGMIRHDDRRSRARNPLELTLVELETNLQEVERLRRELCRRRRLAANLAIDVSLSYCMRRRR